jgi:hypothetical protein
METETDKTDCAAPEAAQEAQVKVFQFTYSKTRSIYSSICIQATSQEEAERFLETQGDGGDLEYKLESNIYSEEDNESQWERDEQVDVESLADLCADYDYDEDVLPVLRRQDG